MNKIIEYILAAVILIVIFSGVAVAAKTGLGKSEKAECIKLKAQEQEFPLFYSTDWQKEMCLQYSITFTR